VNIVEEFTVADTFLLAAHTLHVVYTKKKNFTQKTHRKVDHIK